MVAPVASELQRRTLVDQLVAHVVAEVAHGDGDSAVLPPIRTLARRYGVTIATAQRAVARLEAIDLVEARHGSGLRLRDPRTRGGLALLPYWAAALRDAPDEACRVVGDFLELRRELGCALLPRLRPALQAGPRPLIGRLLRELESAGAGIEYGTDVDTARAMEADLTLTRTLLALRPQVAHTALLGTFERLLSELPELRRAMYAIPARNARTHRRILELLAGDGDDATVAGVVRAELERIDRATLRRLRRILAPSSAPAGGP